MRATGTGATQDPNPDGVEQEHATQQDARVALLAHVRTTRSECAALRSQLQTERGTLLDVVLRANTLLARTREVCAEYQDLSRSLAGSRAALRRTNSSEISYRPLAPDESTLDASHGSEARLAAILTSSTDAIISLDGELRISLWNDGAERLYGYTRREVLGASVAMLMPARLRDTYLSALKAFVSGPANWIRLGEPEFRCTCARKNGEEFEADAAVGKLDVSGELILTMSVRDMTGRKRKEDEQRALAELAQVLGATVDYESTLTQLVQLIAEDLGEFAVLYVRGADNELHRVRAATRDASAAWYNTLVLDLRGDPTPDHPVRQAITTQQPLILDVTPDVLRSLAHSAEHARVLEALQLRSVMIVPLILGESSLGALLLKSARRAYGAEDLRFATDMARTTALLIQNASLHLKARQAIHARDDVLGAVAHDLRNPLQAILLEAKLLGRPAEGSERNEHLDAIRDAVKHMLRLTDDLLDAVRIDSGRLSLDRIRLRVADVVAEIAARFEVILSSRSIELRIDVAPGADAVVADRDRLLQVLENLVSNAMRFTPQGGRITIAAQRREADVLLRVSDTGSGIQPALVPHLFDRFTPARKIAGGGTGLGLSIVKGIVEAHGGRVWADSTVGVGSTFYFTLPSAE